MKKRVPDKFFRCLLLWSAALLGSTIAGSAATLTVTTNNDSGAGSLRQAIADAASGDTINFSVSGTIYLTSGELLITNSVAIGGTNLGVSGNNQSRVFEIGSNASVSMAGLTIHSGHASDFTSGADATGGGIYNSGALTLSNCTLINNRAGAGAASYYTYYPGGAGASA